MAPVLVGTDLILRAPRSSIRSTVMLQRVDGQWSDSLIYGLLGAELHLLSVGAWLVGGLSWWTLRREWRTGRGRDLAVTPIPAPSLFRAKFLPQAAFLLLGLLLTIAVQAGHILWSLTEGLTVRPWGGSYRILLKDLASENLILIPALVLWPLTFWAVMILLPRFRGSAVPLSMLLLAALRGVEMGLIGSWRVFAEIEKYASLLAFEMTLAALLARFVSRRFRELLVTE